MIHLRLQAPYVHTSPSSPPSSPSPLSSWCSAQFNQTHLEIHEHFIKQKKTELFFLGMLVTGFCCFGVVLENLNFRFRNKLQEQYNEWPFILYLDLLINILPHLLYFFLSTNMHIYTIFFFPLASHLKVFHREFNYYYSKYLNMSSKNKDILLYSNSESITFRKPNIENIISNI